MSNPLQKFIGGSTAVLASAMFLSGPAFAAQNANDQDGGQAMAQSGGDQAGGDQASQGKKVKVKASTPKQAAQSLSDAISQGDSKAAKSLVDDSDKNGKMQAQYVSLLAQLRGNARKARQAATKKYGEETVKKKMKMQDLDKMNPLAAASDDWDSVKIDQNGDQATVHLPSNRARGGRQGGQSGQQQGGDSMANVPTKPLKLVKKQGKWRVSTLPDVGQTPGGLEFAVKLLGATNELMNEAPKVVDQKETYKAFETEMEQRAQKKMQPLMQQMMQKAMQRRKQMQKRQGKASGAAGQTQQKGQNPSGQMQPEQKQNDDQNAGGQNDQGMGQ